MTFTGILAEDSHRLSGGGCALEAAGDRAHASEVAALGRQWLLQAVQQVDEAFRDGFLQRNPVNRDLLALAVRLA